MDVCIVCAGEGYFECEECEGSGESENGDVCDACTGLGTEECEGCYGNPNTPASA